MRTTRKPARIRYALIGAGHIAQNAVLPAFRNARQNSELKVIFSNDQRKRKVLSRVYGPAAVMNYDQFDEACRDDLFDALYIALPNNMHAEFTCRAARAGIHVLCEKPMAVTSSECRQMIETTRACGVALMIAYRLHFEAANLKAIELAQGGKLGELRLFDSVFSMQVRNKNIRVEFELGGGPLRDIGIYCINAARGLFRSEPMEVSAASVQSADARFREVDEAVSAVLRFPHERLATFTCSFGAADVSQYQIVGSRGSLRVDPAYEYESGLKHHLTVNGRTTTRSFRKRDQFAPELVYFSQCILDGIEPEPGGNEGLKDVMIIEAIEESLRSSSAIPLKKLPTDRPPHPEQEISRRPSRKHKLVRAESAHR